MDPCLVIGGSSGIGAALTRRLVAAGLPVTVAARDPQRLAAIHAETGCATVPCDATRSEDIAAAVEAARGADGRLGGLAVCVGSIVLKPLRSTSRQDLLDAFAVNALAAAEACRAAEPALRAGNGAVLLFSTIAVAQGFANHAAIAMAKGAVEGLTRTLAAEWAPAIRVNCIAPSLTRTPLAAGITANEAMTKAVAALHALARIGEPDDVAAMAALLLGPQAAWITGQVIHVDGGRSTLRTKG